MHHIGAPTAVTQKSKNIRLGHRLGRGVSYYLLRRTRLAAPPARASPGLTRNPLGVRSLRLRGLPGSAPMPRGLEHRLGPAVDERSWLTAGAKKSAGTLALAAQAASKDKASRHRATAHARASGSQRASRSMCAIALSREHQHQPKRH
jgi:hypothetical protein